MDSHPERKSLYQNQGNYFQASIHDTALRPLMEHGQHLLDAYPAHSLHHQTGEYTFPHPVFTTCSPRWYPLPRYPCSRRIPLRIQYLLHHPTLHHHSIPAKTLTPATGRRGLATKKGNKTPAGMVPAGVLSVNYFNVTDNAILYLEGVDVLVSSMVCHVKGSFYFIDVIWRSHLVCKLVIKVFVFSIHQF